MAFFLVCGDHTFNSLLSGYEHITVQCQNCGNFSGKLTKKWQWFSICWIPVIPFSLKPWHCVSCHICHFDQDIKYRPDVQQMMDNPGQAQSIPLQNAPQGWNQQPQQYQPPQQQPYYK